MPNFSQVLKLEIIRLARKETKAALNKLKSPLYNARKSIIALKKTVTTLEKDVSFLKGQLVKAQKIPVVAPELTSKARITGRTIRAMRRKMGLSQEEFAKLVGTARQAVFLWEHKKGVLKFRGDGKARVLALKGVGAREAKRRLDKSVKQ